MIRKSILASLSLICMTQVSADGSTMQIPEGKITDYHCIHPDITPSAGPGVVDGFGVFIAGDYLYWTAREDNLQYASTGFSNDPALSVPQGESKSPKFHYTSGFKTTLGFNLGHDSWSSNFTYTWFQNNNNRGKLTGNYAAGLTPSIFPSIDLTVDDYFKSATTVWGIHFNSVDWEFGRNCYISKYLSIKPFLGLKGSWQKQIFNNSYKAIVSDLATNYVSKNSNFFWGVGIRLGMSTSWHLSESWSFYGDLGLSAVWGYTKTKRVDTYGIGSGADVSPVNEITRGNPLSPVLELGMGLRKDVWFHHDRVHVGAQVGWEEQVWWDQNRFSAERGVQRGGNLFLQGLTARLRFDF